MWVILTLRSSTTTAYYHYSNLVAERKFHGLFTPYIRDWILPIVPGYPHKGLLGMSNRQDQALQEVHGLGMASGEKLVYDCIPKEASEAGELNGENWRAQWLSHRYDHLPFDRRLVDCSPGRPAGPRRWESQSMCHPTRWLVERAKSVLCFLFAYLYDLN